MSKIPDDIEGYMREQHFAPEQGGLFVLHTSRKVEREHWPECVRFSPVVRQGVAYLMWEQTFDHAASVIWPGTHL